MDRANQIANHLITHSRVTDQSERTIFLDRPCPPASFAFPVAIAVAIIGFNYQKFLHP